MNPMTVGCLDRIGDSEAILFRSRQKVLCPLGFTGVMNALHDEVVNTEAHTLPTGKRDGVTTDPKGIEDGRRRSQHRVKWSHGMFRAATVSLLCNRAKAP